MDYLAALIDQKSNPEALEKLYRDDERQFRAAFEILFKEYPYDQVLQVWYQRLNYQPPRAKPGNTQLFWWAFPLAILAAILTRWLWELRTATFYIDALLAFPAVLALGTYFSITKAHTWRFRLILAGIFVALLGAAYGLPYLLGEPWYNEKKAVLNMAIPVVLYFFLGFVFTGPEGLRHTGPRLDFIKASSTGLFFALPLVLAGLVLIALGVFLFKLLGYEVLDINASISQVLVAGATIPVVAAHMVETQGFMVKNLMALLAKILTPLLFLLMIGFLLLAGIQEKKAFDAGDFVTVINLVLALVLGLTLFSLSELRGDQKAAAGDVLLFALVILGFLIGVVGVVSSIYRMQTQNVTPIWVWVLGVDVVMLGNFLLVILQFIRFLRQKGPITLVQRALAGYLPVYLLWGMVGMILLPLL